MWKPVLTVAVALGFLATGAAAQDLFFLKDGGVYKVEVLKSDWKSVTVSYQGETHVIPVELIEPYCYYSIRNKALEGDAKGRIQLAKYAVDNDMFSRAKAQMDQARVLDPTAVEEFMRTEFPRIKEGLAQRLLEAGERALRRGSARNAEKYASAILTRFEGTAAEPGAEKLLAEIEARLDEEAAKRRANRRRVEAQDQEREARVVEAERDKLLQPVEKLLDEARAANTRGLREKSVTKAKAPLEQAATKYEQAAKRAEAALKAGAPDEKTKNGLEEMRRDAIQGGVQAYLNLAHSMSSRGSYQKAVGYTNKALALDPDNAEAKAARATISTTAAGWDRRRGRR
jgi:tetratricopeptide (TPR) repeat protein